jgi:putative inorganic carbon (hco3(-)) transporter
MKNPRSSKSVLYAALPLLTGLSFIALLVIPFLAWGLLLQMYLILAMVIIHYRLQPYLAKIIAFLLPFSVYVPFTGTSMIRIPTEPLIVLAAMVMFLELPRFLKKPVKPLHREYLWLLPLAATFLLTIPFSRIITVSLKFSFINLLYISVFFVFLSEQFSRNRRLFMQMIKLYTMGMIIVMAWGIYRYWQFEWNPVVIRGIFKPFYNDHTIYGASAALLAAFWFSTLPFARNTENRIVLFQEFTLSGNAACRAAWLLTALILTAGVLLSSSRAAFLSLFVFIMVYAAIKSGFRLKHIVIITPGILLALFVFRGQIADQLRGIQTISYDHAAGLADRTISAGNITTDLSNVERLNRWISAWRMFREKPVTGFGPGTYQFTYIPYQEKTLMNRLSVTNPWDVPEGSGGTAHSEYFLALSEMGLAGLAGLLVFLGRLVFLTFSTGRGHPRRKMIIAAFAALSTYIFHAHFNNFLNTDKFAFLFWGTAAWLIASYHGGKVEDTENQAIQIRSEH